MQGTIRSELEKTGANNVLLMNKNNDAENHALIKRGPDGEFEETKNVSNR